MMLLAANFEVSLEYVGAWQLERWSCKGLLERSSGGFLEDWFVRAMMTVCWSVWGFFAYMYGLLLLFSSWELARSFGGVFTSFSFLSISWESFIRFKL